MENKPSVSIILPCFNPIEIWDNVAENSIFEIEHEKISIEVIIVNDGSTKNFDEQNARNFFKLHPVTIISYSQNRGKGYALRQGVKVAKSDIIIYTDVDFPYTHQSFLKIYGVLKSNSCDVALGIRSEEYYTHLPRVRVRISKLLRFIVRIFLRIPTDDTQCGLKGFNQKGKEVFLQTTIDRYLFDLEFIFMAARKKLILKTVEVELCEGVQLSHMRWTILLQEFGNFLKIFVQSIF